MKLRFPEFLVEPFMWTDTIMVVLSVVKPEAVQTVELVFLNKMHKAAEDSGDGTEQNRPGVLVD